MIAAASESGHDPHIVRLSVHQASHEAPTRISRQHAEIEDRLLTSGLPYTLTGPAAISFYNVAEALGEVLDREVTYIPPEKAKEIMLKKTLPEWPADALNEYARAHSEGYSDRTTGDVERLLGRPATSYKEFASDFELLFRG